MISACIIIITKMIVPLTCEMKEMVPDVLSKKHNFIKQCVRKNINPDFHCIFRARDLKNMRKYSSGLSCRWALFTTWALGFKLHLIFHRVELKKKPVWYSIWRILMVGIGAIRGFLRTRLNIEPYSPLKPTKVVFFP